MSTTGRNPYNCTRPGNLFAGYESARAEMIGDLANGKSFAVVGGRRCGKTSFLLQLEKDLRGVEIEGRRLAPVFLDVQSLGQITPAALFRAIYERLTAGLAAPKWQAPEPGGEYETFLQRLDEAMPEFRRAHGANCQAVLLIDELDAAVLKLPDDQFFQNLRNFLMVSRFNQDFRVAASGVREMARLISSGSSPLNNLCHFYLRTLAEEESAALVLAGFPDGLPGEAMAALMEATGGHPYVLQALLEKLRKRTAPIGAEAVRFAGREFIREHKDFRRWVDNFEPAELEVYRALAAEPGGHLALGALRNRVVRGYAHLVDDALNVLSYHGIIHDSDPDEPKVAGRLFRDWFLENVRTDDGVDMRRKELLSSLLAPGSAGGTATAVTQSDRHGIDGRPSIPDHELASDRPIGRGSYGAVWLGRTVMGAYRAIKVVHRARFLEDQPFQREFNGIKRYEPISRSHPGLVQILHVGVNAAEGYFYYVMELADDARSGSEIDPATYAPQNLETRLKEGRLALAECVSLGINLAEALSYLHARHLIHRDIKPANIIFVGQRGKLADIGLVTEMRSEAGDATWIGTKGYIPPEGPGTAQADIFSLGKVLYEACTGHRGSRFPEVPDFNAGEEMATHQLLQGIFKACADDPLRRHTSALEFADELGKIGAKEPLAEKRRGLPGLWEKLGRFGL